MKLINFKNQYFARVKAITIVIVKKNRGKNPPKYQNLQIPRFLLYKKTFSEGKDRTEQTQLQLNNSQRVPIIK